MVVDYAVVVEFARHVVDDERHGELERSVSAPATFSIATRAYLNDDANQHESLILAL